MWHTSHGTKHHTHVAAFSLNGVTPVRVEYINYFSNNCEKYMNSLHIYELDNMYAVVAELYQFLCSYVLATVPERKSALASFWGIHILYAMCGFSTLQLADICV